MKRLNNLHEQICTLANIEYADNKARRCKKNWGIIKHDKHREEDNQKLLESLQNLTYKTSEYSTFKIYEPKERLIFRLPYYPDRITHHAIMNIMEPIWVNTFIANTYSCIKGRGIHKLVKDMKKVLASDIEGTKYCLKLDIRKFYPSVDHDILKSIIRKKIKDKRFLVILDEIIDSTEGVPIGNYLSQFFANLYLTYFDHWIKEEVRVKYYFRYADDIVILSDDKDRLRTILILIKIFLHHVLNLQLKPNYQIFPVESRGVDFVGYVFYHNYILLRKSIKKKILKLIDEYKEGKMDKEQMQKSMTSYFGWLKYCSSKKFLQMVEEETGLHYSNWSGEDSNISNFYEEFLNVIEVLDYAKYYKLHFVHKNKSYSVKSTNKRLNKAVHNNKLPVKFKLHKYVGTKKNRIKH